MVCRGGRATFDRKDPSLIPSGSYRSFFIHGLLALQGGELFGFWTQDKYQVTLRNLGLLERKQVCKYGPERNLLTPYKINDSCLTQNFGGYSVQKQVCFSEL